MKHKHSYFDKTDHLVTRKLFMDISLRGKNNNYSCSPFDIFCEIIKERIENILEHDVIETIQFIQQYKIFHQYEKTLLGNMKERYKHEIEADLINQLEKRALNKLN